MDLVLNNLQRLICHKTKPNYSIAKIGPNTEKSPGEMRRLTVTQNPVKDNAGEKKNNSLGM